VGSSEVKTVGGCPAACGGSQLHCNLDARACGPGAGAAMSGYTDGAAPYSRARANSRGALLIEVLIALMVLGFISMSFVGAMYTSLKGTDVVAQLAGAESLTRIEMEYIKQSPYWGLGFSYQIPGSSPPWDATRTALDDTHAAYSITVTGTPIDPSTHSPLAGGIDRGVQRIRVQVFRGAALVMTTDTVKINR
jgi:hypothetical protein